MIESHKHCMYCGVNIAPTEVFCSMKCQDTYESQRNRAVRTQRVMLVALVLVFVLAVFVNMR